MQRSQALITDIKVVMKETLDSVELESHDLDLLFEWEERDGNVYITPTAANCPTSQKFKKELSQKEHAKAANCLTVQREEFVITHLHAV